MPSNNPRMTTFAFLMFLMAAIPGLTATPFLTTIGMSRIGPAACFAAPWFQSTFGVNALFSTLPIAAMGGYGLAIVNGVVSSVTAAAGAAGIRFGWSWRAAE